MHQNSYGTFRGVQENVPHSANTPGSNNERSGSLSTQSKLRQPK